MNKKDNLIYLPELQVLKQLREDLGLSQSELSRETGISQQTISRLENGKCDPGYSKVRKIVAFLLSLNQEKKIKG